MGSASSRRAISVPPMPSSATASASPSRRTESPSPVRNPMRSCTPVSRASARALGKRRRAHIRRDAAGAHVPLHQRAGEAAMVAPDVRDRRSAREQRGGRLQPGPQMQHAARSVPAMASPPLRRAARLSFYSIIRSGARICKRGAPARKRGAPRAGPGPARDAPRERPPLSGRSASPARPGTGSCRTPPPPCSSSGSVGYVGAMRMLLSSGSLP